MHNRFALFPGCVMEAAGAEALMSTQAVARALNMELVEMEGWSCCGATHAQDLEPELALVMNARNLALAERKLRQKRFAGRGRILRRLQQHPAPLRQFRKPPDIYLKEPSSQMRCAGLS